MHAIMRKSIIDCLNEDYKRAFDIVFDRICQTVYEGDAGHLPSLNVRYFMDDTTDDRPTPA